MHYAGPRTNGPTRPATGGFCRFEYTELLAPAGHHGRIALSLSVSLSHLLLSSRLVSPLRLSEILLHFCLALCIHASVLFSIFFWLNSSVGYIANNVLYVNLVPAKVLFWYYSIYPAESYCSPSAASALETRL